MGQVKNALPLTTAEAETLFAMLVPLVKGTDAVARKARELVKKTPALAALFVREFCVEFA